MNEPKQEGAKLTIPVDAKGPGVVILNDGTVVYPEGLDEAALKFWQAVEKAFPSFVAAAILMATRPLHAPRPWAQSAEAFGIPLDLLLTEDRLQRTELTMKAMDGTLHVRMEWLVPVTRTGPEPHNCRCSLEPKV